jgi:hypothetical protein
MFSFLTTKVCVEDIDTQDCLALSDIHVDALCNIFSNMVKKVAAIPSRSITVHLTDINVINELKPFVLTITQHFCHGIPLLYGIFVHGSMQLRIIATIEKQK